MRTELRCLALATLVALGLSDTAVADVPHLVTRGESLSSIAGADGLSVAALAAANGLPTDAELVTGRVLEIPPRSAGPTPTAAPGARDRPRSTVRATSGSDSSTGAYRVAYGDTLSAIATRYGVTVNELAAANGLRANGLLLSGTTLRVPTASTPTAAPASEQGAGASPTAETVSPAEVGQIAADNGVPASLAEAIGDQESGFNNDEVSPTGAVGVMQIEPGTWQYIRSELGGRFARESAAGNIEAGVTLLRSLLEQTDGDARLAAAGYYQGLGSVRQHGMYRDTRRYVRDVAALQSRFAGG